MDEKKEKKTRPGRNGGTLRVIEKGEARPATDGGGRPPGSVSLKKLIEKILDGEMTVAEAGQKRVITRREALVLKLLQIAADDKKADARTQIKAIEVLFDRIEAKPKETPEDAEKLNVTITIAGGGETEI